MGYDHESLSSDMILLIMEKSKDLICFLIQAVGEPVEKITEWNNNVCFDTKINLWMEYAEDKL